MPTLSASAEMSFDMDFVSKKMKGKTPYLPIVGDYSVRLDANESPFAIPEELMERFATEAASASLNRYPDPSAREVREAFARRYGVDPEHTVVGNGSDELINLIMTALLDKGDTLAVATPEFSMYAFYAELSENTVLFCPKPEEYSLNALLGFVRENGCRAVVFSNPCNPTGAGFGRSEVLDFVRNCPALCIVDEAYMDFWDQSILDVCDRYENLIVLRTLSKAFGAAGIRCGFAVGHPSLIDALHVARSPYNVNTLTQIMARLVLESSAEQDRAALLAAGAQKLYTELRTILPGAVVYPTRANFVYVKTADAEMITRELAARGIAVRLFAPDHIRVCSSTEEEMNRLFAALREVYA